MEEIVNKMNYLSQAAGFYESLAQANRRLADYQKLADCEKEFKNTIQTAIEKQKQALIIFGELEDLIKSIREPQKIIKPNLSAIPIIKK